MKIPENAPQLHELMDDLSPDELAAAFGIAIDIDDQRYLHWDQLRHRNPPPGLDHRQWWAGIKIGRSRSARRVEGLQTASGSAFHFGLPDNVLEGAHAIDSQARGNIGLVEPSVSGEDRNRYMVSSLIEEAITSSQLEGAATTRKVAADMLRSGRAPTDHSERMILNNYKAMQHILTLKDQPLTPERIFELHRILTTETMKDESTCGRLQQPGEVRVNVIDGRDNTVLHIPPPAEQLPERLTRLCDFANGMLSAKGFLHPVVRAIILHFWLAYDHPFEDGNGRTARALFYWSMLRSGYWLFEYLSISSLLRKAPAQYARSYLYTETDGNDLTYFIIDQMRVVQLSLTALEQYLARKQREIRDAENRMHDVEWMNHRQRALIAHALRNPTHRYTIESHRNSHRVAYATARSDLLQLAKRDYLDQQKRGRQMVFLPGTRLTAGMQ